jgi:large subunit ribosomal protein L24
VKIKSGDTVEVVRGDDRGVRGTVRVAYPREDRVIIEGVNIVVKHQRPVPAGRQQTQGGRIELEAPIHVSNVMLVCPSCQQPTRVTYAWEDEQKVRICKKCDARID